MKALIFIAIVGVVLCAPDDQFIRGEFMEVGMSGEGGYFVSDGGAPVGFESHPNRLGTIVDTEMDGWGAVDKGDYFTPGSPIEGFLIDYKINGIDKRLKNTYTKNTYIEGLQSASTPIFEDTDDATTSAMHWRGANDILEVESHTYLDTDSMFYTTDVTLTNIGGQGITELFYLRTSDPDQGKPSTFDTDNCVLYNNNEAGYVNPSMPDAAMVIAIANDKGIGIGSVDERAVACHGTSINVGDASFCHTSNYWKSYSCPSSADNDDGHISLGFDLGDLDVGQSVSFSFVYVFDEDQIEAALESAKPCGVTERNVKPADILLSEVHVPYDAAPGYVVGYLTTLDANKCQEHKYRLRDWWNQNFEVVGNELRTTSPLMKTKYKVPIRTEDIVEPPMTGSSKGRNKVFTIHVDGVNNRECWRKDPNHIGWPFKNDAYGDPQDQFNFCSNAGGFCVDGTCKCCKCNWGTPYYWGDACQSEPEAP